MQEPISNPFQVHFFRSCYLLGAHVMHTSSFSTYHLLALLANTTAGCTQTQSEFKNKTYHSNNCLEHQKSVKKLCNKYLYFTAPENSAQVTRYREPRQQLILAGLYCQGACSVTVVCFHEQVLLWTCGSGSHIKSKNSGEKPYSIES